MVPASELRDQSIAVDLASIQHAAQISALHNQVFSTGWSEDVITKILNDRFCRIWCAGKCSTMQNDFESIAGFLIARIAADEVEILSLAVAPELRQHGIGKRLVQALISGLSNDSIANVYLEVAIDNSAAQSLYKSCGFKEVGRRPNYYSRDGGVSCDALILSIELS